MSIYVNPGSNIVSETSYKDEGYTVYRFHCGDTKIKIKNEVLYVNNVDYGPLTKGDSVKVEKGKILINNQIRHKLATSNPL